MKKKGFIGLSTLLLVLLLGLYTTSYASTLSLGEVKNILYNSVTNFDNNSSTDLANAIEEFDWTNVEEILSLNYCYVYAQIQTTLQSSGTYSVMTIYGVNSDTKKSTSQYKYVKGYRVIQYNYSTGELLYGRLGGIFNNEQYIQQNGDVIDNCRYNELPLYDGTGTNANITLNIGFHPSGIEDGSYTQAPFAFVEEPTTEHGNVYEFENVPVYEKPSQNDLLLGFLMIPDNITITDFRIDRYYFQGGDWQQKVLTYDQNNPYLLKRYYTRVNNITSYNYWYKQENLYKDNIYYIRWGDTTSEPYQWAYCIFYVKSDGTTISGGMIHNPSGDPIQDIINNGNENDDFWKNVYRELFTLDSGESKEILDNFIENTNLGEVGTLSGELMMLNLLNGEPTDFIISWDTIYSPNVVNSGTKQLIPSGEINFSKLTMRLGNQYEAPTNRQKVLEVINIVRIILGYTVLILLAANLWETIMRVLGIGVGMYEDNEEEKQRLENTEETIISMDGNTGEVYGRTVIRKEPKNKRKIYFKYKD